MIYSKTGKHYSHDFQYQFIKTLDEVDYSQEVTFYHHPYDALQHGVRLHECLDDQAWEYLRATPSAYILHNTDSETFEIYLINDIVKTIHTHRILPKQIHVVVMDKNHKEFLEKQLEKQGVVGVTVTINNYLLNTVVVPELFRTPTTKFSALSRNYRIWRLHVYAELCRRDLLTNFNYSFHNISPYDEVPTPQPVDKMLHDLESTGFGKITKSVKRWLESCPHELDLSNNVKDKWSNVTYDTIMNADFHLLIETHYDQKEYVSNDKLYSRDFSPSSITEKAYKPIACKTPFLAFATPNWLEDLRNLGFKTYAPYINEDYDKETDSLKRLNMIVDEINRICSLDSNAYNELVKNCKLVAEENWTILKNIKNAQSNI